MAKNWLEYWKSRDAWTPREFAQLCCGWNPSEYQFPDRARFNEAIESINRAVRVKALLTIDDLAWPGTGAERMYDAVPAFRPCDVAPWAVRHYQGQFPFSVDDWGGGDDLDPRERTSLLTIVAAIAQIANLSLEIG